MRLPPLARGMGGPRPLWPVALLLFAGCAAPAAEPTAPASADAAAPGVSFAPPVAAVEECAYTCFETSVAIDGAGRLFATGGSTGPLGVSEDGGATWGTLDPPPLDDPSARQSDVLLQASPSGRLYYSALVIRSTPVGGFLLEGIQVAWSEDGGATWGGNTLLGPVSDPAAAGVVLAPDRQWLGFGEGETVYLTYNQIPTGIWAARSDDGGRTWTGWTRALPLETRGGIGQSGPPVVGSDGRVHVAGCAPARGVVVASSGDGGATWSLATAAQGGCSWFPIPAAGNDGAVHVAYQDGAGDVFVVTSVDGGPTWAEPVQWARGATSSPWLVPAGNWTLAVAWYEEDGDSSTLRFARGTADGPASTATVAEGVKGPAQRTTANTDFAHFVLDAGGKAVAVWSSMDEKKAMVARET